MVRKPWRVGMIREKVSCPPAKFIPVLEETGRITELDLYVLKQICQDYQMISQRGYRVVPVSFNLSRKDLLHDDIIERIEAIMARYNVPRELINVEITESAFVEDVERIGPALKKLHELGYQVWMDDFGSGYSSLGILKDYSFDEIKIDMSFLSNSECRLWQKGWKPKNSMFFSIRLAVKRFRDIILADLCRGRCCTGM